MRFDQEKEFEDILFEHWFDFRREGRLDDVLPSAKSYTVTSEDGRVLGYDTREHRVFRQFRVPKAGRSGGDGVIDLLEVYFSVRREGDWGPNLHINVLELKNCRLEVEHLAQLFRYITSIRAGLLSLRMPLWLPGANHRNRSVYVSGALLGPGASEDVLVADSMFHGLWSVFYTQSPIRVGRIHMHPTKGLLVSRHNPNDHFHFLGSGTNKQANARMIQDLMKDSPMWHDWRTELAAL
jgi:hypothetical protein